MLELAGGGAFGAEGGLVGRHFGFGLSRCRDGRRVFDCHFGQVAFFIGVVDFGVSGSPQFLHLAGFVEGKRGICFTALVFDFVATPRFLGHHRLQLLVELRAAAFGRQADSALKNAAGAQHRGLGGRGFFFGFFEFELGGLGQRPAVAPFGVVFFGKLGVIEAFDFEVDRRAADFDVLLVEDEVAVRHVYGEFRANGIFFF